MFTLFGFENKGTFIGLHPPLANPAASNHTPLMSLKNAALLAWIAMLLLSILIVANLITTVLGVMRDVTPANALFASLIHTFASLSALLFFYVFYRGQS